MSGGSAIKVAILAAGLLRRNTQNLTITLADERYGLVGHKNSNWQQLLNAGFKVTGARLEPVLGGKDAKQTAEEFNNFISSVLGSPSYKIALLGLGPDGHTAGILPHSPAISSSESVCYYETSEHKRITITPETLTKLNEAVVYAVGDAKHEALNNLGRDFSLSQQPAQILKEMRKVTIFNDLKGDRYEDNN